MKNTLFILNGILCLNLLKPLPPYNSIKLLVLKTQSTNKMSLPNWKISPKISAAFTQLNFLLGTGPIIVPMPFFQAGFFFSTFWTIVVWVINLTTASYIGQSIEGVDIYLVQRFPDKIPDEYHSVHPDQSDTEHQHDSQRIRGLDHDQIFRVCYGKKWKKLPSAFIVIYLFGSTISRTILTGKNLSQIFDSVSVLNEYWFWLILFFLSGSLFSFKSIQKTKYFQTIIFIIRFTSILLMIIGAFIIIGQNGEIQNLVPTGGNPYFNGEFFSPVFSNLIFAFMFNHSLPGMTKQLRNHKHIQYFITLGHVLALIFMLTVPLTACYAFGNGLTGPFSQNQGVYQLYFYNQNFQGRLDFVYYIISLYIFLNIATFSVSVIVMRRNVLSLIAPTIKSDELQKSTAFTTVVLLFLILIVSFFLGDYIQLALNFTGVLASLLLFILPSMQVIGARKLPQAKRYKSSSYKVWGPYVMIVLGFFAMGFTFSQTLIDVTR